MNRARLDVKLLTRWQAPHGGHDLFGRELPAGRDNGRGTHRFRDRFDAAQSASGRSRDVPPPLPQAIGFRLTEPHPQFDTAIKVHDVQ
jgi:hypothetical protein